MAKCRNCGGNIAITKYGDWFHADRPDGQYEIGCHPHIHWEDLDGEIAEPFTETEIVEIILNNYAV